jgi:hypothetical protein
MNFVTQQNLETLPWPVVIYMPADMFSVPVAQL